MKFWTLGLTLSVLLLSSGCPSMTVCNATGETIIANTAGVESLIEPCECNTDVPADTDLTISDRSGNLLTNRIFLVDFDTFVTFDGFEVIESDDAPDFSTKSTIVFRNNTLNSVDMIPQSESLVAGPHSLVPPGGSRELVTNRTGAADFVVGSLPETLLDECSAEIVDGLEVVWDGRGLTCGIAPPPPCPAEVDIDLCNLDPFEFALPVFMFIKDEETANLETQVSKDACRTVSVPTGAPVTIVVRDIEDVVQLGECTLDEPDIGDAVFWDGTDVVCFQAAAATSAALEPISDPEPDPIDELTAGGWRLSNDLVRRARRQAGSVIDSANPLQVILGERRNGRRRR